MSGAKVDREQLSFLLAPLDPYSLHYFVPHTGVEEACNIVEAAIGELSGDNEAFRLVYIYGPPGSGKTHLVRGYREKARNAGIAAERFFSWEFSLADEEQKEGRLSISEFVAGFERVRSSGGLVLITGHKTPGDELVNPHLLSRLLTGLCVKLSYPREEELRPLLLSLLERRNMRLSDHTLDYLLRRLPLDPLSFDNIFARLSGASYSFGRPANLSLVREVLHNDSGETKF